MDATLMPGKSLINDSPEAGRQLAVRMARLVIKVIQPDEAARNKLRDVYANDATALIQVGQFVAIEFASIAVANGYWK